MFLHASIFSSSIIPFKFRSLSRIRGGHREIFRNNRSEGGQTRRADLEPVRTGCAVGAPGETRVVDSGYVLLASHIGVWRPIGTRPATSELCPVDSAVRTPINPKAQLVFECIRGYI